MSAIHQVLLAGGAAAYQVPYSLRFRRANSAYLSRTPASTGNQQIMTFSWWMKIGELPSANQVKVIFASGAAGSNPFFAIGFNDGNNAGGNAPLRMSILEGTSSVLTSLASDMLFRDPSAWYHCVVAIDTTQATSTNRVKLYVNGTQQTLGGTTTYGTSGVYPSLNANINYNTSTYATLIGKSSYLSQYFDGYLAEMNFIDGQALTPSSFGQTDSATGVWVPKKYSGTYGTNGFYLKFADATTTTTIGNDSSGNANNFTTSGISVTSGTTFDQMLDTPTLNYCVLNPVDKNANLALSNANLTAIPSSTADYWLGRATMAFPTTGKWYWELTLNNTPYLYQAGIYSGNRPNNGATSATGNEYQVAWGTAYVYIQFQSNNAAFAAWGTNTNPTNGDVLMFAFDADNSTMWVGRNGTWYNTSGTANPATNTDPRFSSIPSGMFPGVNLPNPASGGVTMNFGQRAFAYTPPTGFKALNSANLPTPSIKKGSLYMDATLRTGTGATASVSSLGFQPDLVWIKSRSAATDHGLYDAVRGVQKQLESNTTTAETTETTGLTAFNSNGYTVGALAQLNTNTATYVDWAWKEGVTPGFDIVTYVGNGTNRTISHNLGAVPKLIILRSREATNTGRWTVQHGYYGSARYAYLNETFAFDTTNANLRWNSTDPTSSVFSIGTSSDVNHSSDNYVGYLWSEIEGFSKFGSYTGNASADGPFVWCGFRPRWIMIKDATTANLVWRLYDTVRETFNEMGGGLEAGSSAAENYATSVRAIDVLSNGFKIRVSASGLNGSGVVFVFAAFAENPFKYARAR